MSLIDMNVYLPREDAQKRYDICKQCNSFTPMTHRCKHCGCLMKMKAKLRSSDCPLGKWNKLNITNK